MSIRTSPWKRTRIGRSSSIRRVGVVRTERSGSRALPRADMDLFECERPMKRATVEVGSVMRLVCVCGAHTFVVNAKRKRTRKEHDVLEGLGISLL